MELIIQLLFILALISSIFQISQWSISTMVIAALVVGFTAYLLYPWTVAQSKEQLVLWMGDSIKMQNLAVIQVIEALLFMSIDLDLLKKCFGQSVNKYIKYAGYFPGVLWLAALLYVQMICFYSISAVDFDMLAIYFSLGLVVSFAVIPIVLRWVLPENYLRMEFRYILSFGQILGAIVVTVFCQGLPYRPQQIDFELHPLLIVLGTTITMAILGWVSSLISKKIKLRWKY